MKLGDGFSALGRSGAWSRKIAPRRRRRRFLPSFYSGGRSVQHIITGAIRARHWDAVHTKGGIIAPVSYNTLSQEVELYRDHTWRRNPDLRVEDRAGAERLIESVGFCAALTDSRRPGPSLYIAVCGRRD